MNDEPMRDAANAWRKETPGTAGWFRSARPNAANKYFMWANDYPHQDGAWPRSAAAIEQTVGFLADVERARMLGLNAARFFREPLIRREVFAAQGCTA